MASVEVSGWRPGFDKVAFTKLLKELGGFSLPDAKSTTDALLDGHTCRLTVTDAFAARALLERLSELSAIARIIDDGD